MKKIKLWLTTIATLLGSLTASAHDFETDGIYYNITSDTDLTVEVTFRGDDYVQHDEYSGTVTIPSTVSYSGKMYSVTSIGVTAFAGCSSLAAVTIPESVMSIRSAAFGKCGSLASINIPEGVTSIGIGAFWDCSSAMHRLLSQATLLHHVAVHSCLSLCSLR